MLFSYLTLAILAVQPSVAAPRSHIKDVHYSCHDVVKEDKVMKSSINENNNDIFTLSQNVEEILGSLRSNTNAATELAAKAGKLGDKNDTLSGVLNDLGVQADTLGESSNNLRGSDMIFVVSDGKRVIDAFNTFSRGVETELDTFIVKKDIINAVEDCSAFVADVDFMFTYYLIYNDRLANLFWDLDQKKELTALVGDPTSKHEKLKKVLVCKTKLSILEMTVKSTLAMVMNWFE